MKSVGDGRTGVRAYSQSGCQDALNPTTVQGSLAGRPPRMPKAFCLGTLLAAPMQWLRRCDPELHRLLSSTEDIVWP